jgi:YggT family protein
MQLLISSLARIVDLVCQIYFYIVVARALVSWVNPDPYNPIVRFLYNATEPVLSRLRRLLPLELGGFDLSPIVLLLGLEIVRRVLLYLLIQAY